MMTIHQARTLLDSVRAGGPAERWKITEALALTGDLDTRFYRVLEEHIRFALDPDIESWHLPHFENAP
jgi:hypothetical protein